MFFDVLSQGVFQLFIHHKKAYFCAKFWYGIFYIELFHLFNIMWIVIARIILRNRYVFLVLLGLITLFMAYHARSVNISYNYVNLLPEKDSAFTHYQDFKKVFHEEVNTYVLAVSDSDFFQLDKFKDWKALGDSIRKLDGVEGLASVGHLFNIYKNKKKKRFEFLPLINKEIPDQQYVDSLAVVIRSLPFYKGLLYNDSTHTYLMGITINEKLLNSRNREVLIHTIEELSRGFCEKHNVQIHHSGLPYTRTIIAEKVRSELKMFILLALLVTATIMYLFFRSFRIVFFSMMVVSIAVVWALGSIVLLGYQITVISGMIPPLIIVIGIPNCVYLLNKFQSEYAHHGNKIMALQRVIRRIGNAVFLTNLTTALGFATFIITNSQILIEFGVIASLNIMGVFIISILLIPIIFSFLKPPKEKHANHLKNKTIKRIVEILIHWIVYYRRQVFVVSILLVLLGFFGISLMKSTGYMVDDISKSHIVYKDLKFFEKNFKGVMPLEIMVDTKKKKGVMKSSTLQRIDKLQKKIAAYPDISRSMSIVEAFKFSRQAYYNGKEKYYDLPGSQERNFILAYFSKKESKINLLENFIDSTGQYARISMKVADIGTLRMNKLYHDLTRDIYSIFPAEKYTVTITGTCITFFKGTGYLIKNLFSSLLLAILIISIFMAVMFSSWRMVLVSLVPNLIPLIVTAAIMGFFNIPIKPSTVLVFSIAFGISVDDTIHFLAKYRQELLITNWNIGKSVIIALQETGVSMIYTSIVLFFGFSIFITSTFGGTIALGILVSITLLIAMLSNTVLLPSLLLSLEKRITTKTFKEPLLHVFDEEEDIDFDELEIESKKES